MIDERINNENDTMELNETVIQVCIATGITDEELFIVDKLKVLLKRDEKEEYLPFKEVDQR